MVDAWGIDDGYWDIGGHWHDTAEGARAAIRAAMGADTGDGRGHEAPPDAARPVWIVQGGSSAELQRPALLVLEDGTERRAEAQLPADLPLGYHDLHPTDGGPTTRLIVVPEHAAPPPDRAAAVAVQLYASRSTRSWGIGDLADAALVGRWARSHGADLLLLSPLHAPLPVASPEPSPYFASSRRFRSPLHLRIEAVPGWDPRSPALLALAERGRALLADRRIDRAAVWATKRAALEHVWEQGTAAGRGATDPAFHAWRAAQDPELERYATFCALVDHHGAGWRAWPVSHRHPDNASVGRFAAEHQDAVAFHAWLQWLADRQHAALADGLGGHGGEAGHGGGLVHDLAVGADPDGADAWLWQDVLADGVRVGAPPDEFNGAGQDWGLPPFVPWRLRAAGYEPFVRLLRAAFEHAAGLRVDHVMGLFRLWWIPDGAGPADGAYVRFPGTELLDILALESVRAGAFVVGEDLGTVEDHVRSALAARQVLSYRVAWFEPDPPDTWPRRALAAVTTHDLPTLAGVRDGTDPQAEAFRPVLEALLGEPSPSPEPLPPSPAAEPGAATTARATETAVAVHRRLATAPCNVVAATLEDALGVRERPNMPGTTDAEHPNWSVALPVEVDHLDERPGAGAVLDALSIPVHMTSASGGL